MLSGRSPTVTCRPAGASRDPLGKSVVPSDSAPGEAGAAGGLSARARTAHPAAASARMPSARVRVNTTLWRMKGLVGRGLHYQLTHEAGYPYVYGCVRDP